jgi:hypothetical protein
VPSKQIQKLRQIERRYVELSEQSTQIEQQMDRQLHRCNIQITNYATKIGSTSVIKVVRAIVQVTTNAEQLVKLIHARIRNKYKEAIAASLIGVISETNRFIFEQNLREYDIILCLQQECLMRISEYCVYI